MKKLILFLAVMFVTAIASRGVATTKAPSQTGAVASNYTDPEPVVKTGDLVICRVPTFIGEPRTPSWILGATGRSLHSQRADQLFDLPSAAADPKPAIIVPRVPEIIGDPLIGQPKTPYLLGGASRGPLSANASDQLFDADDAARVPPAQVLTEGLKMLQKAIQWIDGNARSQIAIGHASQQFFDL